MVIVSKRTSHAKRSNQNFISTHPILSKLYRDLIRVKTNNSRIAILEGYYLKYTELFIVPLKDVRDFLDLNSMSGKSPLYIAERILWMVTWEDDDFAKEW